MMIRNLLIFTLLLSFSFSKAQSEATGIWINKAYYETLSETKSPYKTHKEMDRNYISHITISDAEMLYLGMRFHDSIPLTLEGKKLHEKNGTPLFELRMEGENLMIKNISADRETEMIRVPGDLNDVWRAIQLFVYPQTFVGSYEDTWSDASLVFKSNGEIFGMEEYIQFEIGLDCTTSTNYDYIYIFPYDKKQPYLGWEMKGNRLILFTFKGRSIKLEKKKVIYKLKRS